MSTFGHFSTTVELFYFYLFQFAHFILRDENKASLTGSELLRLMHADPARHVVS